MSGTPVRVGVPRVVSGLLERPALLGRLDDRARLTVVRGVAGSGKSSLVASWLAERDPPDDVLWVARIAEFVSRAEYWEDVLRELDRFGIAVELAGGGLDDSNIGGVLREAFSAVEGPLTLVLDNFGPPGHSWDAISDDIGEILGSVPGLRIVVIGREPTRLETAGAAGVVIETDDLRFSRAETRRLAELAGLGDLGDADLEVLLESSRGIVFPLRYALEAAVRARRTDRPTGNWAARLAAEVLDRLRDPGVLEAAGALAQAPFATADLVVDLLGTSWSSAEEVLRRLARPGIAVLDADGVLRFVEAARVPLRDAYRAANPGRAAAADVLIARWLRERGRRRRGRRVRDPGRRLRPSGPTCSSRTSSISARRRPMRSSAPSTA